MTRPGHTARLLPVFALIAMACGTPTDPAPSSADAGFPHAPDYGTTNDHGADAIRDDANCGTCHTGADAGPPACDSCHALWPHATGFRAGDTHGTAWLTDPAPCAACHGDDGRSTPAGLDRASCASCHSTYPHTAGFEEAAGHGPVVRARGGSAACDTCHDDAAAADDTAPSCQSCHDIYPHAPSWDHIAAWSVDNGESCAQACHPTVAGQGQVACSSCHDQFPHPDSWSTGHAAVVQRRGEASCTTCHADGSLPGPTLPTRCGSCHDGSSQ